MADAEFSSLGNADSSNVKGPSDMIYIKWSILFFLFSSSSPAGPQRQTQTLRKCSARLARHHSHCKKLSYKAQCLSGGKKQTLSRPSAYCAVQIFVFCRRDGIIDKKTDLFVSPAQLSCRHVKAAAVEQDTVWISSVGTMLLWDFSCAQVSENKTQCSVFPQTGRLEQNPNELGWLAELNY